MGLAVDVETLKYRGNENCIIVNYLINSQTFTNHVRLLRILP